MDDQTQNIETSQEQVSDTSDKKQKPWLFKKGQSGNPEGRPKGSKSLKTWVKEYLEQMDDEERIAFLNKISPDIVWRMAEGQPHQSNDTTVDIKPNPLLNAISNHLSNPQDTQPKEEDSSNTGGNISG